MLCFQSLVSLIDSGFKLNFLTLQVNRLFEFTVQFITKIFHLAETIDLSIQAPRGIALTADGNIAVCGGRTVVILNPAGIQTAEYPIETMAECIAGDEAGIVYLGTGDHVSVLDTTSGQVTEWTVLDERSIITSIAVSHDRVFVADAGTRRVWVFDSGGMLVNMIEGFVVPSPNFDLAALPDGRVWIVDPGRHTIGLFDQEGRRSVSFGRYSLAADGFSGCCNPTNLAIRGDGSLVTVEKGIIRVKLFGSDGDFVGIAAGPRDFPIYDAGVDIVAGMSGEVLILFPRIRKIFVFEENES